MGKNPTELCSTYHFQSSFDHTTLFLRITDTCRILAGKPPWARCGETGEPYPEEDRGSAAGEQLVHLRRISWRPSAVEGTPLEQNAHKWSHLAGLLRGISIALFTAQKP